MKSLSVGRLVYDVNILMENYPIEGSKNSTKEIINCSGGPANITAYALAKWNVESFVSGVIGYDETGSTMKKNMEENKVRTNYLETNYEIKTPISYIIRNKQNNTQTTIEAMINDYTIKKYDYDLNMDLVITDGSEYNASVTAYNKFRNGVTVFHAKQYTKTVLDFFKYAKYVICDSSVAEAITGLKLNFEDPAGMATVYKKMVDKFPMNQLLIRMEDKGTIYAIQNEIKILADMNSEVIDKTGAKDIFAAMVGYGLATGYPMEIVIKLATIAADLSKKTIGSTLSIPSLSDVIQVYESRFGKLNLQTTEPVLNETNPNDQNVTSA